MNSVRLYWRFAAIIAIVAAGLTFGIASGAAFSVLPNAWILHAPSGTVVQTETMPQGASISVDGSTLAVVESGYNPPSIAFYSTQDLRLLRRVAVRGAFGRPAWVGSRVFVAGANADAVFALDPASGAVRRIALRRHSYPIAIAVRNGIAAVACDGDGSVRVGAFDSLRRARAIFVGRQLGAVAFSPNGATVFVTVRSSNYVAAVDLASGRVRRIHTDLHPSDVLVVGSRLYVAQADADTVAAYDVATGRRLSNIFVGTMPSMIGSSPNSLAASARGSVFVTLGAANDVAQIHNGRVVARYPAGWYPTAAIPLGDRLFIIDGKGEGTKPNRGFDVMSRSDHDYIASIQFGSIREVSINSGAQAGNPQDAQGYDASAPRSTVLRAGGPIQHVFFILKENRTYDQVLGDAPGGNGDAKLVVFGAQVTPNQHAIAARFGLFDNFYASGEVSDSGHNWVDGAFANDYVERNWPMIYGNRKDDDEELTTSGAGVPARGYIWDEARRAGVSFRDYGELTKLPLELRRANFAAPSLGNRYDMRYVGWDLKYSDLDRYREWKGEFDRFVATDSVPQLEWIWLPNDHTMGTHAGALTPSAYVAQNDYAVGLIVSAISHSKIWGSSAVFITEDDAQDGADHVSDQRTTSYIASPYARGGVIHDHYSTLSFLRTIELLLGMKPLSNYDASAVPLYSAFGSTADLRPFDYIAPQVDLNARNARAAYGSAVSERLDFSRPDAATPGALRDILQHSGRH
jgi:DNA-binding beta-propeller fold protein YncE